MVQDLIRHSRVDYNYDQDLIQEFLKKLEIETSNAKINIIKLEDELLEIKENIIRIKV